MTRIGSGGSASSHLTLEPTEDLAAKLPVDDVETKRAQKAADSAGLTGSSGFTAWSAALVPELSGKVETVAPAVTEGLGSFRASQLTGVSSASLSRAASDLSVTAGSSSGRKRALSDDSTGEGVVGVDDETATETVTETKTPGPFPGVEVRLNGEVLSLNDALKRGSTLPMRDQMNLAMQLVDQNLPAVVDGKSPMTVNGIDLATTKHKDLDFGAAVARMQSGNGNSEDRAIVQAELMAQMGVPKERMQISYGSFCDPTGKKLHSQAALMVLVPDRPLSNPNAEALSTWHVMEKNAAGQPKTVNEFMGREWHYQDGKVAYLPLLDHRATPAEPIPVDNSKGFFVPTFGVQVAPGFNRGSNVIDYSKAQQIKNAATGGATSVSLDTAYALSKFAPSTIANGTVTNELFRRFSNECQARAFAQLPSGAPKTLDFLNKVQDWSQFSRDTIAHLGLPESARAPFEDAMKRELRRATQVQDSFNINLSDNLDWTKPKYADGTLVQTGDRLGVDRDGNLLGVSLTFDDELDVDGAGDTDVDGDGKDEGTVKGGGETDSTTPVMTANGHLTNASFIDATKLDPDLVASAGATFMQPLSVEELKNATIGAGSLIQTNEGNCWVLSPLDSVARTAPGFLDRNMTFNDDGTVTVKLFRANEEGTASEPIFVKMQATVPKYGTVDEAGSEVVFGKPAGDSAEAMGGFKAALFQKAIAIAMPQLMGSDAEKFGGGYRSLGDGGMPMMIMSFLGGVNVTSSTAGSSTPDEMFTHLMNATRTGDPIVAGTRSASQIFEDAGLYDSHAYTVIRAFVSDTGQRFVQVRNPHGRGELGTIFNDAGPGDNTDSVTRNPNGAVDGVDDGIMNVPYEDFFRYFKSVTSISLGG